MAPETRSRSQFVRTRRIHQKSRKGCFECKRRRVKCDEGKPSCKRCVLSLDKCIYPAAPQYSVNDLRLEIRLPSPPCSSASLSPNGSSHSKTSPPVDQESYCGRNVTSGLVDLSETTLYDHYLQHTSGVLSHCPGDQHALQIGIPALALESDIVYHSVLAVSAACIGCDMISEEAPPAVAAVTDVLMTGYRHYNLASERLRESLSMPDSLQNPDPLMASALLLMPFATSSQRINHWISSRSDTQESVKFLSSTPRDVIVIMRGIRATLQSLGCDTMSPAAGRSPAMMVEAADQSPFPSIIPQAALAPSRNHAMFSIVAATSERAFSRLQTRIESAGFYYSDGPYESLSACSAVFRILKGMRNGTFTDPNLFLTPPLLGNSIEEAHISDPVSLPCTSLSPWLRSFATRCADPQPTEPLTRYFLNFLVRAPQAYLDIVLPLLDQRLEVPSKNVSNELTREQALALDIYAHWSVFMLLVEDESWWIGDLSVVTLTGMINRYGDDFVTRFWNEDWWPGTMLKIVRETRQYR